MAQKDDRSTTQDGAVAGFLDGHTLRRVAVPGGVPFQPVGLALGHGTSPLEVLIASNAAPPNATTLRSAWKARNAGRAAPLLFVVLHGDKASLCGPAGEDPPAYIALDRGQIERICREALEQPDRHAALRALRDVLPSLESDLCGLRNEGFLATHELRVGARQRADWEESRRKARAALPRRGEELLRALGFRIEPCDGVTRILRAGERKVAVAVLLTRDESPELQGERFSGLSPVTYALAVADRENLPWVVVQHGAKVRVYPTRVGVGVGRRGRTETYVECHAGLVPDVDAAYLWLLCSAEALLPGGSLEQILEASGRFAAGLAERLRERIYQSVVPHLAEGIVAARGLMKPTAVDLADTYEMALVVLFRLLFVAYAEDKDLLPYRWNGLYRRRSLKTKAQELAELAQSGAAFDAGESLWDEVARLFRTVDQGNREWGVPPYDGGLFSEEREISLAGTRLAEIALPNTIFGPALRDLLLVAGAEGLAPVDFRSLGVREFGTIYEGLLESELSVAETDLAVDRSGVWRPCRKGEEPLTRRGAVYLHDASGARKSSGSYFTKQFAVEHLLERSLEPALVEHLARLDALGEEEAGERFFDFRVADLAMGSGHFLVAAIDRIERALTGYLWRRRLPVVAGELAALRAAAVEALGPLADQVEIEDTQLLRRLIARRCIYGVDLNATAVHLARLSVWIHTFVSGLPLSLLDHNLVRGNSLVGIGRLEELGSAVPSFFQFDAAYLLGEARGPLERLARIADATLAELGRARQALKEAHKAVAPVEALCNLVTAARLEGRQLGLDLSRWNEIRDDLPGSREHRAARERLKGLHAFHFSVEFPEVFLRERPGFDVIVGNPPWDKIRFEEDSFFCRYIPGLNALPHTERKKAITRFLAAHPSHDDARLASQHRSAMLQAAFAKSTEAYKHQGSGHLDSAKLFVERIQQLLEHSGHIGLVLPRQFLVLSGWKDLRELLFAEKITTVTQLRNRAGWVFPDAEHRYVIALLTSTRAMPGADQIHILPGADSPTAFLAAAQQPIIWSVQFLRDHVSDDLCVPQLTRQGEERLLMRLLSCPGLGSLGARPYRALPYAVLDVGKDLKEVGSDPKGLYVSRTRSLMPFGYEYDDEAHRISRNGYRQFLKRKLEDAFVVRETGLAYGAEPEQAISLVYRYPSRNDDTRTLIASMLPNNACPAVGYVHSLITPNASESDRLCLLAFLNSLVWDWVARRFVDRHVTAQVVRLLPVPRKVPKKTKDTLVKLVLGLLEEPLRHHAHAALMAQGWVESKESRDDLLSELDSCVAELLEVNQDEMALIFEDFSEEAVPAGRRTRILSRLRGTS